MAKKEKAPKAAKTPAPQNSVDPGPAPVVASESTSTQPAADAGPNSNDQKEQTAMETVTLTRRTKERKNDKLVIFELAGRPELSVQFHRSAFPEQIPTSISITADLAPARVAKAKETPEERKARLKALPKPTLEEKARKAEERAAKLKEKLAKQQAKAAAPTTDATTVGDQPAQG